MNDLVSKRGLAADFFIDSAATSTEEIGNGVHPGTRRKLARMGIPCGGHKARQMTRADYERFDYLIGMEGRNVSNMLRILGGDPEGKVRRLLPGRDIADPWYTGDFDATYEDVAAGCGALLEEILG